MGRNKVTVPGTLKDSLSKLIEQGREAFIGTVVHRQIPNESDPLRKGLYWCDVQPERDTDAKVEYVPMAFRVMNHTDDFGIIIVPKMNAEVIVAWVDGRPTIDSCQEWDKLIFKKDDSNYFMWDLGTNNVEMKTSGTIKIETPLTTLEKSGIQHQIHALKIILGALGPYSAVQGEILNMWLSTHTHTILKPTPGSQTSPPTQIPALGAHLSKVVKLD